MQPSSALKFPSVWLSNCQIGKEGNISRREGQEEGALIGIRKA